MSEGSSFDVDEWDGQSSFLNVRLATRRLHIHLRSSIFTLPGLF